MGIALRKKKLSDGRTSLYLDIYRDGKRTYEFLELYLDKDTNKNREILDTAEAIRAQRQLDVELGKHGFVPKHRLKANFIAYFDTLSRTKELRTYKLWLATRNHLVKYGGELVPFAHLTKAWLSGFRAYLLENLSQNSASTLFAVTRSAIRAAYREDHIRVNPCEKVKGIPQKESSRSYLLFEELEQLAATPCKYPEVKRAFLFACYCGLRYCDVEKLTWYNIGHGRIEFSQEKTDQPEYLDLSQTALELLGPPGDVDAPVFDLPSTATVNKTLKAWGQKAKLKKKVTFHVARHTFATLLLTHDRDLYTVSKLLGHKSIQHTQRYAKIIDRKKMEAVNALPRVALPAAGASASAGTSS